MPRRSAGLLLYRRAQQLELLLVHPGGPWWARRDAGAWSIPKGELRAGEDPLQVAERELTEELGRPAPGGERVDLGEIRQAGGKLVRAWAVEGDFDTTTVHSNELVLHWPPRSGTLRSFPEVDRAEWVTPEEARRRLVPAQVELLQRLLSHLGGQPTAP